MGEFRAYRPKAPILHLADDTIIGYYMLLFNASGQGFLPTIVTSVFGGNTSPRISFLWGIPFGGRLRAGCITTSQIPPRGKSHGQLYGARFEADASPRCPKIHVLAM